MKKVLLPILFLLATLSSFGQGANLDRESFNVSYISLPSHPIEDPAARTYSTNNSSVYIAGFKKANPATITIRHRYDGTQSEFVEVKKRISIKKDKDGNVISRKTYYSVVANFYSTGSVDVQNALTARNYNKQYNLKDKYTSSEFSSYSQAVSYYNNNKYRLRSKYARQHKSSMRTSTNYYLNDTYGYPVNNKRDIFWILGKKKHPEYGKHKVNYEKAKAILAKMKHNEPIDAIATELEPIISYFDETAKKYVGKKKKYRKMRYASYYNNAKIYYYLDNPAKTREYANKLIANDYDKRDGKMFNNMANKLEKRLNANKVTSRHFDVSGDVAPRLAVGNEVLAYLITRANDTIQTVIPNRNIPKIGYFVELEVTNDAGNKAIKRYMAEDCKTLALTNEDMYQVVNFDEAKKGPNSTAIKFVKALYESDKIGLYLFNEKELVIKFPNQEKGISTMSSAFAFGLNKQLAKYAVSCPEALAAAQSKEFKNTAESLTKFCKMYTACK
jgi:hypothetical protein